MRGIQHNSAIKTAITFVIGTIVGTIIQTPINDFLQEHRDVNTYIFIGIFLIITILSVYYFSTVSTHVNSSMDSIEKQNRELINVFGSTRYVGADYSDGYHNYQGKVYKELSVLARSAKFEILALSVASIGGEELLEEILPHRDDYFATIENTIRGYISRNQGFTYKRIFQIPDHLDTTETERLRVFLGQRMFNHCKTIIEMETEFEKSISSTKEALLNPEVEMNIAIKALGSHTLSGFVIIDKHIVRLM